MKAPNLYVCSEYFRWECYWNGIILTQKVVFIRYNHLLSELFKVVNTCLNFFTLQHLCNGLQNSWNYFYQYGIKNLNLYLSVSFESNPESHWPGRHRGSTSSAWRMLFWDGSLCTASWPAPPSCYRMPVWSVFSPIPGHKVFPSNPGLPGSCSAVLSVGILEPKCSELEVSAGLVWGMPCWVSTL